MTNQSKRKTTEFSEAYPVCEFVFLNFNHIGFAAISTAGEGILFFGQLPQYEQE